MRRPTQDPHAWWRDAVSGGNPPRYDGEPQPGWYARRYIRNGPLIPVRVYLHQEIDHETGELAADEEIRAEEMGSAKDAAAIWTYLKPITVEQFDALVEEHRTNRAMAATHVAIDLSQTPMRP